MIERINENRFVKLLLALSLTLTANFALADIEQSRLDAVTADIQARIDANKLSGAVVMIAQDGEIQMTKSLGYQNVEDQVPMSDDTIFRIFSMTSCSLGCSRLKPEPYSETSSNSHP